MNNRTSIKSMRADNMCLLRRCRNENFNKSRMWHNCHCRRAMNSENSETVTVYSVAERRGLSGKYLEQVLTSLRQARLIKGIKGSRGGYILNKKPEKITLKEIIDALDPSVLGSDVAVVNDENTEFAQVLDDFIWLRLENKLKSYTESITLRQLVDFYNKESVENVSEPMYYI